MTMEKGRLIGTTVTGVFFYYWSQTLVAANIYKITTLHPTILRRHSVNARSTPMLDQVIQKRHLMDGFKNLLLQMEFTIF